MEKYLNDFKSKKEVKTTLELKHFVTSKNGLEIEVKNKDQSDFSKFVDIESIIWINKEVQFAEYVNDHISQIADLSYFDCGNIVELRNERDKCKELNLLLAYDSLNKKINQLCLKRLKFLKSLVSNYSVKAYLSTETIKVINRYVNGIKE